MEIMCSVTLSEGQTLVDDPDTAAVKVLDALGGNPTDDHCVVHVHVLTTGEHGGPDRSVPPEKAALPNEPPPEGP